MYSSGVGRERMTDVVMAYDRPSQLVADSISGERILDLVPASGGDAIDRPFFTGWVTRPKIVAQILLTVAAVARSTYFRPVTSRMLDPILTSGNGCLRIESFSSCCGVYARADVLPDGLEEVTVGSGTTNVDLNQEVRDALSRVDDRAELRLSIGAEGLHVVTRGSTAFERKVKLPNRWIKGLGEAALVQLAMRPVATLDAANARRLLTDLPPEGRASAPPYTVAERGRGLRFQQSAVNDAAVVAGPYRLRELVPLAAHATAMTVWARPGNGVRPCAFQVDLPAARMWLVLSSDVARGFSGEGVGPDTMSDPTGSPRGRAPTAARLVRHARRDVARGARRHACAADP